MRQNQRIKLRDCMEFNPQVYVFCFFCYKHVELNSYDLHQLGYPNEVAYNPAPEILMKELENKLLKEGWILPYMDKKQPMCGDCAKEFAKLDDLETPIN